MRTYTRLLAAVAVLTVPACHNTARLSSVDDITPVAAAIVDMFHQQVSGTAGGADIVLGKAALREAASKSGATLSMSQLDAAIAAKARRVERAETAHSPGDRFAHLIGDPFYIGIRSFERTSKNAVTAIVETSFNSSEMRAPRIHGSIYSVTLRRDGATWSVVSLTRIGGT